VERSGDGLPSGEVTFMFSDIEGSTRLFHDLEADYPYWLGRHQTIVRARLKAHGGHEVKTEGDSFFVAFWRASDAVSACVDIQRDMAAERWPENNEIRIRIGMHTGTAAPVDGDYVALAVHRAARVAAVGHGGQILLSAATVSALGGEVPSGCSLDLLGRYRLKDFDEPEPLTQVNGAGLESRHPPLKAVPAARHNIRPASTRFVGRRRERQKLQKLLADNAVVTVVAPGGVGKSRLAAEVALEAADGFDHGATYVELGGLPDDDLVIPAIVEALGVRLGAAPSSVAALTDAVSRRTGLIVLDEAERVTSGVATAAATIVAAAPDSRVLITSRQPIDIAGELVVRLDPMSVPDSDDDPLAGGSDAVALLFDRLGRDDDWAAPPEELRLAASLCRRLDGLPLAIELAAARVHDLGLADVVTALAQGGGDGSPVHDAVRWTYSLLGPSAQRVFRRLRWLAAPVDVASIASVVCGADLSGVDADDVGDLLSVLADRALVRRRRDVDGDVRYRMLETVRDVAGDRLRDANEDAALDASLVDWCVARVEAAARDRQEREVNAPVYGEETRVFLNAIDAGIRVGHSKTWLVVSELVPTLTAQGAWPVLSARAEGVRAIPGTDAVGRAVMLLNVVRTQLVHGEREQAMALVAELEASFDGLDDEYVASIEADLAGELSRLDPAMGLRFAEHALPRLRTRHSRLVALVSVGGARMQTGDVVGGQAALVDALALARQVGDDNAIAVTLGSLGSVAATMGRLEEAVGFFDEAAALLRRQGTHSRLGIALSMSAAVHSQLGHHEESVRLFDEALALRQRIGDVIGVIVTQINLADGLQRMGRIDDARTAFARAFDRADTVGLLAAQLAAAHGMAVTSPDADAEDALALLVGAISRDVGVSAADKPGTEAALERLRGVLGNAADVERGAGAIADDQYLALARQMAQRVSAAAPPGEVVA
jgi:predicted ATPase/class 3 adenylate cyclase